MELTEERLDAMERRCYRLDDSRITEAERYVHQLVAEVRRLRNEREEARGLAREYRWALMLINHPNASMKDLDKDAQFHPWLLEPEPATATGVAEAVFGIHEIVRE
jgi:hypothetical protein